MYQLNGKGTTGECDERTCKVVDMMSSMTYGKAMQGFPDSKVHGANMGPIWVLSAPDGPHVGPMNLAIGFGIEVGLLVC